MCRQSSNPYQTSFGHELETVKLPSIGLDADAVMEASLTVVVPQHVPVYTVALRRSDVASLEPVIPNHQVQLAISKPGRCGDPCARQTSRCRPRTLHGSDAGHEKQSDRRQHGLHRNSGFSAGASARSV